MSIHSSDRTGIRRIEGFADRLGLAATSICALHCLALTIWLWLSPVVWFRRRALGLSIDSLLVLEIALAAIGIAAAIVAFASGFRIHRRRGPGGLFLVGATLLAVGVFGPIHYQRFWGTAAVLAAGGLLIAAHLWNLRLSRVACRAS